MRLLEPTAQIWMKIDPYCQRQKCRPMTVYSVWKYKVRVDISGSSSWPGRQTTLGVVDNGNFLRFRWLRLRKRQRYGKQYYMTICYPLSADNWVQNEWPWMTLSGYFMSKSDVGQYYLNQSGWMSNNNTTSAILRCSVHCTISKPTYVDMRSWRAVSLR